MAVDALSIASVQPAAKRLQGLGHHDSDHAVLAALAVLHAHGALLRVHVGRPERQCL